MKSKNEIRQGELKDKIKEVAELIEDKMSITIYANRTWKQVGGSPRLRFDEEQKLMLNSKRALVDRILLLREENKLAVKNEREEVLKLIDDVNIELMLTDIKDNKGNKVNLSDEIMELISIWWDKKSEELKAKLEGK